MLERLFGWDRGVERVRGGGWKACQPPPALHPVGGISDKPMHPHINGYIVDGLLLQDTSMPLVFTDSRHTSQYLYARIAFFNSYFHSLIHTITINIYCQFELVFCTTSIRWHANDMSLSKMHDFDKQMNNCHVANMHVFLRLVSACCKT